jgi:hypothetical protein
MTVLFINHRIIKCISILTAVIHPMIKFDVDTPRDCFRKDVQGLLAICYQLPTLSAFNLDCVRHLPHALLPERILIVCQKGINEFEMVSGGIKVVEIMELRNVVPC